MEILGGPGACSPLSPQEGDMQHPLSIQQSRRPAESDLERVHWHGHMPLSDHAVETAVPKAGRNPYPSSVTPLLPSPPFPSPSPTCCCHCSQLNAGEEAPELLLPYLLAPRLAENTQEGGVAERRNLPATIAGRILT